MSEEDKSIELGLRKDKMLNSLNHWTTISVSDLNPLLLFQKAEQTVEAAERYFKELDHTDISEGHFYERFKWSVVCRDFLILLRDTLMSSVKYDQLRQDKQSIDYDFENKLAIIVSSAAKETLESFQNNKLIASELKDLSHQVSPVKQVLAQIDAIQIQLKKIHRSHDKVNEIRINLEGFQRELQLQYHKQITIVSEVVEAVGDVETSIMGKYPVTDKPSIQMMIDKINEACLKLEENQNTESIELISYPEDNQLSLPIDVSNGELMVKSIHMQGEVSKWYSSLIYPHIIELENRRDLALDKSLNYLHKIRVKLAALILDEESEYDLTGTAIKQELNELKKSYIESLIKEEEENSAKIESHISEELFAANVYSDDFLFLPHVAGSQITDISRDAQKRMTTKYKAYKGNAYNWFRNLVSKYIEIDRVPYNSFISNKLALNKDDERLSLFLKKGYLGKSFTIERHNLTEPILNDYNLWNQGFSGGVLIYGPSGSGKSTIIGMLPTIGMKSEFINLRAGEPYFTQNRSFEGKYDIEKAIDNIANQYLGKKVIITIDDLEQWHKGDLDLYDNVVKLIDCIHKYKSNIFFVISCGQNLKNRIDCFRDLDSIFSSQIEVGKMSGGSIRNALVLRHKALPELGLVDKEHENTIGDIIRIASGNVGHAMLEYCRFFVKSYDPNLKSQEFNQMIQEHEILIKYILTYQTVKLKDLADSLNEVDLRTTRDRIDFLEGHKILVSPKTHYFTVNPFLIYSIEKALDTI